MASPTLEAWLPAAKEANPSASEEALTSYYQQKYGPAPSSLPTLQSWLPQARKANPEADDATLTDYWQSKYGAHGAKEKDSTQGDFSRGFKDDLKQLPQLGYGLMAGAGATAESIVGEGGLATGLKKAGVKGFEEKGKEIAAESKPSDSFNYAYDRAKDGDFGALVDWAQYSLGHAGAQALESLGAFAAGTAAGGPVVGAAAAGSKAMVGKVATDFMGRLVAKESARLAASGATKGLAAEEVTRLATANVAKSIGQKTALALQATGMEGGEIMGDLAAKSVEEGRALTGEELAKGFGATLGAGALEFVGDKIGLDLVLGKSKVAGLAASAPGTAGRVARGTLAGTSGAMAEGATEFAQTLVEEAGKGNDPFSDASVRQAVDAAAMGTIGGGAMGATGGVLSSAKTAPLNLPALKSDAPTIDVEDMPAQIGVTSPEVSVDDAIAKATSILSAPVGSDRKKADDLSSRLVTRMEVQDGRLPTAQEAAMLSDTIPQRRPEIPILPGAPEATAPSSDIQIVSPPSKPPVSVDDPRATIAAERQRILAMKQNAPANPAVVEPPAPPSMPATTNAPMPSAVDQAYASVPELLELAKKKGLDPETAIFKEYTKMVTGKSHLDELTPQERDKLAAKLGRVGTGDASKPAPPASAPETAPVPAYAAPHESATVPRSELSPEHNADMLLRAEKAQADMGAAGNERGGRYFMDQDGHGSTQEVRGLKSATAPWYKELTKGRNPLKRDQIETAIQKIIQDDGVDVGKAVERVKEALLNDREFRNSPWGEDADAIMRGEWPPWIPKPEGYTPPQAGPAPSVENPSAPVAPIAPTPQTPTAEAATIDDRAHEAATSPNNDLDEPTEGQKGAGNYKLGHDRIGGLNISIENPEGSTRSGKDANGKPWSVTMKSHYGYIRGTKAADSTDKKKQGIDVFVKPNTPRDYSGPVFVVDQKKGNGKFDEHKVMLGYDSLEEARARYKENYAKDWNGIQAIKDFSMEEFKAWLKGDTTQPAGDAQDRLREEQHRLAQKRKPQQQEIPVPPPTIGERPLIAPEAPLSETPLFSKGAQEPEPEQTKLPEEPAATGDDWKAKDYNDLVRASTAGTDARRRLGDLPSSLYHDVIGFAETGQKPTPGNIEKWLASKGTIGAVESLVKRIKAHHADAKAIFDEGKANTELERRRLESKRAPKKDATPEPTATTNDKTAAASKLADFVKGALNAGRDISDDEFFETADFYFGGTRASGAYAQKEAYDALELGINRHILSKPEFYTTDANAGQAKGRITNIRRQILDHIPTQKANRTEDQNEFQQFSTPPDLAWAMNWAANITKADTMLEPSAGIGGIAVFAKISGARVVLNEYHDQRADLLRQLNIGPVYQENAEQLNNILPDTTRPTVIVMNPPFSSTAGRKQGERNSKNVLRHLDQALARLEPGGRLVALIGQGRDGKDAQFLEDWKRLTGMKYAYRGRIGLSGEGYKKYGTTYDNQILIFDKIKPDGRAPINANVADVFEALPLLSEVRDARTAPTRSPQQASTQSGSETLAQEGGRRDGSQSTVPPAAPTVGARGERSGTDAGQPSRPESTAPADRGQSPAEPGQGGGAVVSPARPGGRPDRPATPEPAQSGERPDAGGRRDESAGQPERSSERGPDAGPGLSERLTVEQGEAPEPSATVDRTESDDSIFESYTPKKVRIKGAQAHPGKLVESAAMAAIDPPDATYKPAIPKAAIEEGRLSGAQLEPIVYAGQAHEQLLPDGSRRGFFDGDGTGVGKGREIAGILLDNWKQGRKKAVWMSKNSDLFSSAVRDWTAVAGTDGKELFSQGDLDLSENITRKDGILFSNYLLLGAGLDLSVDGKLQMKKQKEGAVDKKGNPKKAPTQTRLDQMVKWLGPDFDGVIVFDEAHEMRNNMATSGGRGDKKPAMKALAGVELQKRFPKARIAYFSATGGIEVSDFGYAERLGMWGNGTPFANKLRFVGEIQQGGLAAMELVSQDLKANGLYTSRSLSYDDVTYERLEHVLTADQREMYDEMARGWQIALQNLNRIMEVTGADKNGAAKSAARSLFWGTHQRFYEQVLTSLQMPTVIKRMEKDLEAGHAVVIQLTKTNAAPQDKQIKLKNQEGGELDDLDLTPREGFLNYVRDGFPTQEFETYIDENGNERSRPVVDSNGAPVQNKEAVEMRDALLERLGSLRTPENPLDLIINTFGEDTVAEVTGRGQRLVRKTDKDGKRTTVLQKRSKAIRNKDAAEFMDDKRQGLVFSDAGGTGQSYHADLSAKNQRRRMHYVIQPGWRADAAMQGLGRTHRSNAASSPHYILVSTDLKGHKRFISTIARRLAQLGALTRGQRQTSSQGLFSEADNLENAYAASSLESFFRALKRGDIKGHGWQDTLDKLGLQGILDKNGNIMPDKLPDVPQFLNRILSLEYADQNDIFDAWFSRMEAAIEMAKANGQFDSGMENYRADSITLKKQQVVYENPETKATTRLMTFEAKHRLEFRDYKATTQRDKFHGFFIGQKTGRIYAALRGYQHTDKEGKVEEQYKLLEPDVDKVRMVGEGTFTKNYRKITGKEAEKAWKEAIDKAPKTRSETLHILSGAMLGIWDRIGGSTRVYRVTTDDGKRTVGRVIGADALTPTLERLGVKADKAEAPSVDMALDAIENGGTVELANGWKLGTRRVNGEDRIEIMGYGVYGFREELKGYGAFVESIRFEPRVFIPTENPKPIIEKVVKHRPILKITGTGPDKGPGGGGSGPSFQRRDAGSPRLGAAEMRAVAGRINAGDTRVVVTSFDALPNRIKEEAAKLGAPAEEIRAVYDHGTVYLVEDRFESEADAEEAVFHELYHKWIAGHLGSSMQDDLNALFDRMGGPEALLTMADRYQWKEARAVMQAYAKRTDLSRREKTAAVVNELLAEMGSRSVNPTALQKIKAFIGAIRQWLRDHGLATLSTVTESDLLHLLQRARSTHGELKAQGNRPYFQSTAPHPTFYSQAARVVERKMPNKASADQVRAILSPNNGVKPDEMKWIGLDDYLNTKDAFTKQDVLDFISQNEVQVQEVMKGDENPNQEEINRLNDQIETFDDSLVAARADLRKAIEASNNGQFMLAGGLSIFQAMQNLGPSATASEYLTTYRVISDIIGGTAADRLIAPIRDGGRERKELITERDRLQREGKQGSTKFSAYQLPGGQNYRELLLTLPPKADAGARLVKKYFGPTVGERYRYELPDGTPISEYSPSPEGADRTIRRENQFTSTHFSEPNILAHVRFNDRMVDGKKVLFLEEVQSDWHQRGRKHGYAQELTPEEEAERSRLSYLLNHTDTKLSVSERDRLIELKEKLEGPPDAPFKKTWHELALKRMLRYAAEHGYDSLAWTTGEQQAERYDLSKHVEDIGYEKRGDLYNVTVWGKDGQQLWQNQSATLQQVEETIGKELADKMQKGEGTKAGSLRYFSGLDLKVGGEGMKGFYDKILPDYLNKYGKKWGSRVEAVTLPASKGKNELAASVYGRGETYSNLPSELRRKIDQMYQERAIPVHFLPITDAMKESVMTEGQPLFQTRTSQADLPDLTEAPYVPDTVRGPQQSLLPTQGAIAYELPAMSKMDDVIRTLQDKNIDLARLVDTIKAAGHEVHDDLNPVLKEELYLGRVSKQTQDFLTDELRPLVDAMRLNKVTMEELDEYLHARHAREANEKLAAINPDREDNEALSGMTNEEADRILREADRPKMDRLAARVDSILAKTRRLLVDYGLESQETVNAWMHEYSAYVPLHREGYEDGTPGTGQGRSVRGPHAKARTGSNLKVTNILANVAMDREKAIVRGEKMRPVIALAGLLQQFPNSDIATLTKPADITYTNPDTGLLERVPGDIGEYRVPMVKGINRKTGEVEMRPDPTYKGRDNVVNFRLNGVDHAIVFNEHNDRAVQMARALKDLDVGQLNTLLASVSPATRYLASINTQFNPVFGVVNFIRDIQFAMLTLGTTPLANKRAEVRAATFKAIKGIYQDARAVRRGEHPTSPVAQLWERFQKVGGPTGYRDMFRGSNDRAKAIEHMLNPDWWQKTLPGRILTAGGRLSGIEQAILDKAAKPLFEWLSDYNQAMENAVRLGVFQVGLENGMSDEQAASAAKNITVNFNKKGQITTQVGALYAFFNASVQGTARIAQTLFEKGQFGVLSDVGKKIVQGGIALGALQAFALSMAGFEDEEPPEWMKARSLIIPVPGTDRGYVSIPMPLGFNVLPSLGRLAAESLIHGKPIERAYQFIGTFVDAFSPVGGAGTMSQFLAPTAVDPFVALSENKDWTGRSIYREDFNRLKPTPGMTRAKDTASPWARGLAEAINWATGGTEYTPGHFSPTPDSIDYLIAQMAGGVGREASKAAQTLTGLASGEEVPMHKIPLAGRLVGSASDLAARRHAFYDNLREVTMHGEEVEGRRRNREDAAGYLKEHPEAQLSVYAGQAERQVQDLTRRKRELLRQGGNSERARLLDMQIDRVMERFNERMKQAQETR